MILWCRQPLGRGLISSERACVYSSCAVNYAAAERGARTYRSCCMQERFKRQCRFLNSAINVTKPKWALPLRFSVQNYANISNLLHAFHMQDPPQPPWSDHIKNIWWKVQIMKLLLCRLSYSSLISSILVPNILLSTLFWKGLNLYIQQQRLKFRNHTKLQVKL
jgi:hypothetical protein